MKKVAIVLMMWVPMLCGSIIDEQVNCGTKRRKTDLGMTEPEVPIKRVVEERQLRNILQDIVMLPHVIASIALEYAKRESWEEAAMWNIKCNKIQQITCNYSTINSISQNSLWKRSGNNSVEYFKIENIDATFYTKTYMLYSPGYLYFLADNDSFVRNSHRWLKVYRMSVHGTKVHPELRKTFQGITSSLSLSGTTRIGIIKKGNAIVFDCITEKEWLVPARAPIKRMTISSDDNFVALSGRFGIIRTWNIETQKRIKTFHPRILESYTALAISSSKGIVAASRSDHIIFFNGTTLNGQENPASNLYQIDFSSDGHFLVAYNYLDHVLEVRDGITGILKQGLKPNNPNLYSVSPFNLAFAIAPDSRRIVASYMDGRHVLWEPKATEEYDVEAE